MKKIFYIITIIFLAFFTKITYAETMTMPTDEEIRATIKKFNIDKSQEEYVFQETKKKLTEIYSNKENLSEIENLDLNNLGQELEKQTIESVGSSNNNKKRTKKYTNHDPIFKKQKYGPKREEN